MLMILIGILSCAALADGQRDSTGLYDLDEYGEAIINDVTFHEGWEAEDNNRVFYEIFVGSFSDSDGDGIGDLRGVINRFDYLNDGDPQSGLSLGVEGIWLTPIFSSPSYHKYDVTDFYTVDPDFGTLDDLRELIGLCHERNVKLILDLPINHTGKDNQWFKSFLNAHLMHNDRSDYYNFYVWLEQGAQQPAGRTFVKAYKSDLLYEANFSDTMPEPDFDNPFVRQTLLDVGLFYLNLGVDGFRFDAAKYIYLNDDASNADFWSWYIGELKKVKPDLYTVAEVWDSAAITDRYIPSTNCFNFETSQVNGLIAETAKAGNVNTYTAYISKYLNRLHSLNAEAQSVLFISNHDMDRAAGYLTNASGNMKVAANLYLLSPGSPFLYYGEEIGMRGSRGGAATDANRRLAMLWGDGDTVQDPVGANYDMGSSSGNTVKEQAQNGISLLNYYKRLLMIRKANPEIARGKYAPLVCPDTKLGGFTCTWEGKTVAVLHNTTQRMITIDLSTVTDHTFTEIAASISADMSWIYEEDAAPATLEGTLLTMIGQTSVVLR